MHGTFSCLNCLHSYSTKNKFKKYKNLCGNYDYWYMEIPKKDNKLLKYNHGEKPIKSEFVIFYVDAERALNKTYTCHDNPKKSSAIKKTKHKASGYSLFTHYSFDATGNRHSSYRDKDCMKNICKDLREHIAKIINCEKNEMMPLTVEENKSYHEQKVSCICKKEFSIDDKNTIKADIIVITLANIEMLLIMFVI